MGLAVEKGPDAFRTISEVADDLDLPQHVLRFWETRFAQIKPLKRGGGRRYYRPEDVDLLRGIRHLLYADGYTIRGVQQILREQGVRHVQSIGRAVDAEEGGAPEVIDAGHPGEPEPAGAPTRSEAMRLMDLLPQLRAAARPAPEGPRVVDVPPPRSVTPVPGDDDIPPLPFRRTGPAIQETRVAVRPIFDDEPRRAPERAALRPTSDPKLSPEAVRLLKATLFELGECQRLLDSSSRDGSA